MDAFSVSLANGLNEPGMRRQKMCGVAGAFAFFQGIMPMIGWIDYWKKFGTKSANKATIFGGVILIIIGIEIFVTGVI